MINSVLALRPALTDDELSALHPIGEPYHVDGNGNEACALCWAEDGVDLFGPCARHD